MLIAEQDLHADAEAAPVLPARSYPHGAKHDHALELLTTRHIVFDPNSPEAQAVKHKIDRRVMPLIVNQPCEV